jgi:hypothetical protein
VGEGGVVDFGQAFDLLDIENRTAPSCTGFRAPSSPVLSSCSV